MISILFGVLAGIGLPIQTSINTRLRKRVGTPYRASLVSFFVALLFLVLLLLVTGQGLSIPFGRLLEEPVWIWTGGICGVIFLTGNILLFSKLGGVQTVVLPVLGQILMGLVIDHFGFFFGTVTKLSILRVIGALAVILGVFMVSLAKGVQKEEELKTEPQQRALWLWRLFGIIAGMLSATQIAVNGYLGKIVDSPVKASAISFVIGIVLLTVICFVTRTKERQKNKSQTHPWWIWFGGILGGTYILANVSLSSKIGTGMTVIVLLIGATAGGLLVDHFGLFDAEKNQVNIVKILGVFLMVMGAAAIKVLG